MLFKPALSPLLLAAYCASRQALNNPPTTTNGVQIQLVSAMRRFEVSYWKRSLVAISGKRDFTYLVDMIIGGKHFSMALDTGSTDLWVASSNCSTPDCEGVSLYSDSATLNRSDTPFSLKYVIGNVTGTVATETVILSQYEITYQTFAIATSVTNFDMGAIGCSGVLGLAFTTSASIHSSLPLMQNIMSSLDENDRYFAFRLGRDDGNQSVISSFAIGQHDPSIGDPSSLLVLPVYPKNADEGLYDYWKVPIDGILVNSKPLPLQSSRIKTSDRPIAVFDSGTTLILGPTLDIDAFYGSLTLGNATRTKQGWMIDCRLAVDLVIMIGGRAFPIHPLDVAWDKIVDGHGMCFGGLQANDGVLSGDYLFGDTVMRASPFRRNIYTSHHAQTAKSPPLLGLLSTTSPLASLAEFRAARAPLDILIEPSKTTPSNQTNTQISDNPSDSAIPPNVFDITPSPPQNTQPRDINTFDYYNTNARYTKASKHALIIAAGLGFVIGALVMYIVRRVGGRRDIHRRAGLKSGTYTVRTRVERRPSFLRRKDAALGEFTAGGAKSTARNVSGGEVADASLGSGWTVGPSLGKEGWSTVTGESESDASL